MIERVQKEEGKVQSSVSFTPLVLNCLKCTLEREYREHHSNIPRKTEHEIKTGILYNCGVFALVPSMHPCSIILLSSPGLFFPSVAPSTLGGF